VALADVTLDDKYALESGRIFLTGTQALVRLLLMQRQRDLAAGLNTAGFVSGYRGSPLGNVDRELWQIGERLEDHHIHFQPGVNEDLAATSIWGSQQASLLAGAKYDGVFGLWYGKGPGVDRSGDVFRHANMAGTSPHGGVLVLAGDDPGCKSSTVPSQSEHALIDAQIPVLHPANVQEFLDFGLLGWAMSRYSGCWVAMKTVTENVDSSASVLVDPGRVRVTLPEDFEMPPGGVHIRLHDWPPYQQEVRLQRHKLYAALAFARANALDRVVLEGANRRLGIVTTGKTYLDVMQALDDLGIDERLATDIGLGVYKVGLPWPLEPEGIRRFACGLDEILVVEEKRAVIENQLKEQLYNWQADVRPRVIGKFDEDGEWILPSAGELTPARIARVIARRIERFHASDPIRERLTFLEDKERTLAGPLPGIRRQPYFCSGCPHNTSTRVPEGSHAVGGIGCHFMVTWMDRSTETYTHMGGEGANWIGIAPFTEQAHTFVNIGDGTYFHSGLLAIRAGVAAGVNVTYKILFNDAVAMTGGQPMDGPLDVAMITRQVAAEGVKRIAVVTDEPEKYATGTDFAPGVAVSHRDDLDKVQRELREVRGPSVLVYDQTCAAEKRRRRKRGLYPDPPKRAFINEAVCEGCGDCGIESNCVSIIPKETEFGRKRAIDQSSCNKDFSCLKGFCPSFVTVNGGRLRKPAGGVAAVDFPALPEPVLPALDHPYGIVVAGIGGTGVVTIGALLGMAAHLEGKGVSVLDQIGLAQKNGAVVTHVRIAGQPDDIHAVRISAGGARLLLGCDIVNAGSFEILAKLRPAFTRAVVNTHATMTADFTHDPDLKFPARDLRGAIERACGADNVDFVDGGTLATELLGDSIAANLFMVGFAYQKGLLPVSAAAIERAIEINATAVDFNKQAFLWGRRTAHDKAAVERIVGIDATVADRPAETLDDIVARRIDELTAYQNAAYAARYSAFVDRVRQTEAERVPGETALAEAVARSYFKLLAYKDEYEVARLYADGRFEDSLRHRFDGEYKLTFHLAPPILGNRDPLTGRLRKREFGPWVMSVFRILARLKGLRGTAVDIFGRTPERKMERRLITDYETTLATVLTGLDRDNHAIAREIAALPETIRGFGHVKEQNLEQAKAHEADLLDAYRRPAPTATAAE
jgi:indolepyruvate ferredoxin oxidoreductase